MFFSMIIKKILSDIRFYIVLGFIILLGASIFLYNKNRMLTQEIGVIKARSHQNDLAWQDSLKKKAAQMTELAVFVRDLQTKVSKTNKEVVFWKNSYKHVIDSVHDQGSSIPISGEDSIGKYSEVPFSGKKSIASYKGAVKVYLTPLSKATWVLDIGFDDIHTTSEFDRDKNGVFFIRTTSLTPGVNVIGYSTLDSAAYPYLYGLNNKLTEKPSYTLYGGGLIDRNNVSLGIGINTVEWLFLLNYRVFQSVSVSDQPWYSQIQIGIYRGIF